MSRIHGPSFKAGLSAAADLVRKRLGGARAGAVLFELERLKPPRPSTKASRFRSQVRAEKTAERQSKNEETRAIRVPVFARATPPNGFVPVCELCQRAPATDLHHAFGRVRVKQAVENCLALCRWCHEWVTNPKDAAAAWLRVAAVFERLGLIESAAMARTKAARTAAAAEVMGVRT